MPFSNHPEKLLESAAGTRLHFLMRSPLLQAMLITLVVLLGLMVMSHLLEQQQISHSAALGELIDVSGRQRMLSQRLAKNLHKLDQLEGNDERAELLYEQLRADLELFNQQHSQLLRQVTQSHFASRGKEKGSPMQLLLQITPLLSEITRLTKTLLLDRDESEEAFEQLARQEALLVRRVDQFNRLMSAEQTVQGDSRRHPHHLLGFTMLLLVGGAFFSVSWCVLKQLHESRQIVNEQRAGLQQRMDELARTKERLGTAIAATTDGMWCWTVAKGDVWYSDKFWQLLGYNKSAGFPEASYRSFLKHLHPDDRRALYTAIQRHYTDRFPLDLEARLLHVEGVYHWVRIQGSASYGSDQRPLYLAGAIEDIHERKVTQLKLKNSEQLLTQVGRVAKIGGWSYDIATWELVLNEETLRIHDLPPGSSFTLEESIEFYAPEARPIIQQAVRNGIERGESWDLELPFQTALGRQLWVRAQGEAEFSQGQPVRLFGSFQDVTSRKIAEAEVYRLQMGELKVRAHLEGVINSATEISIIATDAFGMITLFSPGAERLLGYSAQEMVGQQSPLIFHLPDEMEQRANELEELLGKKVEGIEIFTAEVHEGAFSRREWTYVCKNGEQRTVDLTITAIRDRMQNLEGFLGIAVDMSEKKQNEKQLERLANVASRTTNGVVITDAEGRIEWINPGFTRMCGHELAEVVGKKPGEFLQGPMTDRAEVLRISGLLKRGLGFTSEIVNYRKNGERFWVHIKADPVIDAQGKLIGFMAIQSDITSRKVVELELRESREQMRRLLEALPAAAYTCDHQGLITFFNRAAAEMWGREPELNHPADRYCGSYRLLTKENQTLAASESPMAVALRENRMIHGAEIVIECEDGARRTALAHANPLYNGAGNIVGGVNVLVDISDRIELENSLREATARLELCLKILDKHSIVAETELNGTIRHVNDYFCEISGYSRDEIVGKTHRLINSGHHPVGMWKEVFRTVAETGMWQGEVCNRCKNGDLYWVETTIATMRNGQGQPSGYFVIRNDITELKAAKEAALASSRSKSEFLANMSHEIRTPLTAILGYAELLQDDVEIQNSPEKRNQAINTIREAGQHLLTVINDILDLSKIEAGKMSIESVQTDLAGILQQVESLFRPRAAGKGVLLQTELASPIPSHVLSDPTRLRQILMNLVGNAVKFTEHGNVRLVVRHLPGEQAQLQVDIIDTGRGMSIEQQRKLFQPFEQADASVTRQHGGTGLGLVICRRLARLMQGEVTLLESAERQGTRIRLELPCQPSSQARQLTSLYPLLASSDAGGLQTLPGCTGNSAPESISVETQVAGENAVGESLNGQKQNSEQTPAPSRRKPEHAGGALPAARVLLAEDGPDNQRLISFMLRKLGLQVEIAENGRIALERLLQHPADQPEFALLITDMQMPELDGYSLARTLRDRGFVFPIIALTAHAMAEDRQKCTEAGCDDYLTKPVNRQQLAEVVGQWLQKPAAANSDAVS